MVPKMRPARREATLRLEHFRVPEQPVTRQGAPTASLPGKNLVISAALAEYTALRAEATNRISGQDTMLNLYMTAVAAIFGCQVTVQPAA
jgi:hypothetical protein